MKTLAELYGEIGFWSGGYRRCDKGDVHSYIPVYEELLAPYRLKPGAKILEIGLFHGASLEMWVKYFHQGEAHGVDGGEQPHAGMADLRPLIAAGYNISIIDATDPEQVAARFGGYQFDVIIEDANHFLAEQLLLYTIFKDYLAPGGLYVIEDIQDLDRDREIFQRLDSTKQVEIVDLRAVKDRFDDVLVLVREPSEF